MNPPAWTRRFGPFRVATPDEALAFVEVVGFCYTFTPAGDGLPALFEVLATDETSRKWAWVWDWKERLPAAGHLYYGRVLGKKPAFIALDFLPAFYAAAENVGEPDDARRHYEAGRLSQAALALYDLLDREGPMTSRVLARRMGARRAGGRVHAALRELETAFLLARAGEEEVGGYAYRWDRFDRVYPEAVAAAGRLAAVDGAVRVLERYRDLAGEVSPRAIARTFGWPEYLVEAAARRVGPA